jgi:DNA polymerase IIIc chi subunit
MEQRQKDHMLAIAASTAKAVVKLIEAQLEEDTACITLTWDTTSRQRYDTKIWQLLPAAGSKV